MLNFYQLFNTPTYTFLQSCVLGPELMIHCIAQVALSSECFRKSLKLYFFFFSRLEDSGSICTFCWAHMGPSTNS